jgi:hypothetical protein
MVFLFNVGGYYIVFWGLREHHNSELSAKLDANLYSKEETVELKIPMTLPYPHPQRGFERVNGKFEHNGEHYKLVKQQLRQDTLYVVCIRDVQEKRLVETMEDYVNLSNDMPSSSDKDITFLGKLLKDFETLEEPDIFATSGWCANIFHSSGNFDLITQDKTILSPPPKV